MKPRSAYKGTRLDYLIGMCQKCRRNMMFSDSIIKRIEGKYYQFHEKCWKEIELKPAKGI